MYICRWIIYDDIFCCLCYCFLLTLLYSLHCVSWLCDFIPAVIPIHKFYMKMGLILSSYEHLCIWFHFVIKWRWLIRILLTVCTGRQIHTHLIGKHNANRLLEFKGWTGRSALCVCLCARAHKIHVSRMQIRVCACPFYTITPFNLVVPMCSVLLVLLFRETGVVHRF